MMDTTQSPKIENHDDGSLLTEKDPVKERKTLLHELASSQQVLFISIELLRESLEKERVRKGLLTRVDALIYEMKSSSELLRRLIDLDGAPEEAAEGMVP